MAISGSVRLNARVEAAVTELQTRNVDKTNINYGLSVWKYLLYNLVMNLMKMCSIYIAVYNLYQIRMFAQQ